jgi:cytochrome P450
MREMIRERRQSASEGRSDLFTHLVKATSLDPKERTVNQLSDEDLMGMHIYRFLSNLFIVAKETCLASYLLVCV